jgi:pSer/pThr/pTyr-binding forkhead associated (FHA) protein
MKTIEFYAQMIGEEFKESIPANFDHPILSLVPNIVRAVKPDTSMTDPGKYKILIAYPVPDITTSFLDNFMQTGDYLIFLNLNLPSVGLSLCFPGQDISDGIMVWQENVVIGRRDEESGVFPEVDLLPFLKNPAQVSRRQACLRERSGEWSISLHSKGNMPVYVDQVGISPGEDLILKDGSVLGFSGTPQDPELSLHVKFIHNQSMKPVQQPKKIRENHLPVQIIQDNFAIFGVNPALPIAEVLPSMINHLSNMGEVPDLDHYTVMVAYQVTNPFQSLRNLQLLPDDHIILVNPSGAIGQILSLHRPGQKVSDGILVEGQEVLIGRGIEGEAEHTIDLTPHLRDPQKVSRYQAWLRQKGDKWFLVPHPKSSSPVYINQLRLAKKQVVGLDHEMTLGFGGNPENPELRLIVSYLLDAD